MGWQDNVSPEDREAIAALVKRVPGYVKLATGMLKDPNVPKSSKALLGASGAYMMSPIDLVPGIIPIAGQLDDVYVLLMGIRQSLRSMPDELAEKHLAAAGIDLAGIENDINLVTSIAGRLARMVITAGARIGRAGKSAYRIAAKRIRRQ